ncbi:MAG: hypothetical protein HN921_06815 [Bacteroidetes bacterium]|nr:hypothetical protein [Bacteroidota bacterium]
MNKSIINELLLSYPLYSDIPKINFEKNNQIDSSVILSFKSLGDLVICPLLIKLLKEVKRGIKIKDILVEEEYHDYTEFLNHLRISFITDNYGFSHTLIGCFDTNVKAYKSNIEKYDFVFPLQFLRPLYVPKFNKSHKEKISKLVFGETELRVLTIGSFSCSIQESIKVSTNNEINQDFIETNSVRFLNPQSIIDFVDKVIDYGIVDRVLLTPRNITEEKKGINQLLKHSKIGIVDSNLQEAPKEKCLIIAGKGVLKQLYAISDYSIVMGYHNILEPNLSNPQSTTFCINSNKNAPNFEFWECGKRMKIILSYNYSSNILNNIFEYLKNEKRVRKSFLIKDFKNDSLYINSQKNFNQYIKRYFKDKNE